MKGLSDQLNCKSDRVSARETTECTVHISSLTVGFLKRRFANSGASVGGVHLLLQKEADWLDTMIIVSRLSPGASVLLISYPSRPPTGYAIAVHRAAA
jgi:hypothetical protein